MPHFRSRYLVDQLKKLGSFWPAVGLIGPRQAGKTTLLRDLLGITSVVSLDDLEHRELANASPKVFLAKLATPVIVDEVQKAPALFDALKLEIDRSRRPGRYYLTGSASFSARIGVRESLTGRIGLARLGPMTLGELEQKPRPEFQDLSRPDKNRKTPRFDITRVTRAALSGGMPVPAFARDEAQRDLYWQSWLETTLYRDLQPFFKRGFDPDFALRLVRTMADAMRSGELPSLKHFASPARKVRQYLDAMENIFLIHRVACHPSGIGKDTWLFMDSGLAAHLLGRVAGEAETLTLIRHFLWNEWLCRTAERGELPQKTYYKSAQGQPVDAVIGGIPFRIVSSVTAITRQLSWEERPLVGAMKKLKAKFGFLVAPTEQVSLPPTKGGIGVLPWGMWS